VYHPPGQKSAIRSAHGPCCGRAPGRHPSNAGLLPVHQFHKQIMLTLGSGAALANLNGTAITGERAGAAVQRAVSR
jgi:hypothetical protein